MLGDRALGVAASGRRIVFRRRRAALLHESPAPVELGGLGRAGAVSRRLPAAGGARRERHRAADRGHAAPDEPRRVRHRGVSAQHGHAHRVLGRRATADVHAGADDRHLRRAERRAPEPHAEHVGAGGADVPGRRQRGARARHVVLRRDEPDLRRALPARARSQPRLAQLHGPAPRLAAVLHAEAAVHARVSRDALRALRPGRRSIRG